jgi:phospholipid transport system substrate-binding protein
MRISWRLLVIVLLIGFSDSMLASISPSTSIKQTVDEVLAVLRTPDLGRQQRRDMVRDIVRPRFDYRAMSQIILAQNWRKATALQKDRFVELFRDLIEYTYFSAMDKYTGETVRMGLERTSGNRAIVQTYVNSSTKEVPVNYSLRLKDDDWFAYDVTVDGVSLVSNYRTSFRNLVNEKGMDGLLQELKHKVDSLKASSGQEAQAQ